MKKPRKVVTKDTEPTKRQHDAIHDNHAEDVLTFDDSDFAIDETTDRSEGDLFIGKDIAEGDVYDKEVLFADDLNGMQRNAVALHIGVVRREYENIDQNDQQAVTDFWHKIRNRIHEDHGFMAKDIEAILEVLQKILTRS